MLIEDDAPKRRRATAEKYVEIHSARSLVRDSQRALGEWQTQVARLRALKTLRKGDVVQIRQAAGQLLPAVVARRIELQQAVETADPKVAGHSLVRDVENAFIRLEDDLMLLSAPDTTPGVQAELTGTP